MTLFSNSRFSIAWKVYLTALVFFTLTRIYLLIIGTSDPNSGITSSNHLWLFSAGWLYDTVFYLYALLPVSLYLWLMPQRLWQSRINSVVVRLLVFATIYGLGFIAVSELLFWDEFNVRFNFISVDYLVYRREITENINESYPLALLLSSIFVVSLFVYYWLHKAITRAIHTKEAWKHRAIYAFANFFLAFMAVLFIGQDLRSNIDKPIVRELGSNGPYQFIAAFRNNKLDYNEFYKTQNDEFTSQLLKQEIGNKNAQFVAPQLQYSIERTVTSKEPANKHNIMLVMIESLSADFMGTFGNDRQLTPNLDKLVKESLLFTKLYATGTRTTRGLEAVTLSIPPTPGRSIVKRIGHETGMSSLGNVLKEQGYDVNFIYGGRGYFDNMNAFFSGNGYSIIDQNSTPEEEIGFKNAWGMADEYLFDQAIKAADKAQQNNKPFFYHIMTTSNHRPYSYPDDRIDIPSGTGRDGAVKYTDWAIGNFLDKARERDWFDNTLFVFVADHTAGSAGKTNLPVNRYHIPMLVYAPTLIKPETMDRITSQIDIAPTLLGMLNKSYTASFFGKDVLNTNDTEERALIGNYQHLGYYTQGKLSVLSPQQKIQQLINPEEDNPELADSIDQQHINEAIAYYQGAYTVYTKGLNRWNSPHCKQTVSLLRKKPEIQVFNNAIYPQ